MHVLAGIIVLIIIGVIVIGFVFAKCIVPGLGKLKNRMFVE